MKTVSRPPAKFWVRPARSLLSRQYPRPIADLRLCAPPPEHRRMGAAPTNRSRPPSPPCSSPAKRLLAPAAVQIFHPRTRARTHAACQQPLRTRVGRAKKRTRNAERRPQSSLFFKRCPRAAPLSFVQVCEARALGILLCIIHIIHIYT